jgi:hypothetical protein
MHILAATVNAILPIGDFATDLTALATPLTAPVTAFAATFKNFSYTTKYTLFSIY